MLETFRCRLQIHGWKGNLECLVRKQSLEKAPRSPREAIRPQLALEPGTPKEYFRMAQSGSKRHRKTKSKISLRPVCTFLKGLLALSSGDLTLPLRVLQTEGTAPLDPHVTITNRFLWQVLLSQAWFCPLVGFLFAYGRLASLSTSLTRQEGDFPQASTYGEKVAEP